MIILVFFLKLFEKGKKRWPLRIFNRLQFVCSSVFITDIKALFFFNCTYFCLNEFYRHTFLLKLLFFCKLFSQTLVCTLKTVLSIIHVVIPSKIQVTDRVVLLKTQSQFIQSR